MHNVKCYFFLMLKIENRQFQRKTISAPLHPKLTVYFFTSICIYFFTSPNSPSVIIFTEKKLGIYLYHRVGDNCISFITLIICKICTKKFCWVCANEPAKATATACKQTVNAFSARLPPSKAQRVSARSEMNGGTCTRE